MNKNIKYLVESILDDFYDDEQSNIIGDFLRQGDHKYFPINKKELKDVIQEHYDNGIYNLNDIDVSLITDFSSLFTSDRKTGHKDFDISKWDVSNGEDFSYMFFNCETFNSDLSKWDVSSGENFKNMFYRCKKFNCDLSKWDVSIGKDFNYMFYRCEKFNCDLSQWVVSKGEKFTSMFDHCLNFNCDLSQWDVRNGKEFFNMFNACPINKNNKYMPAMLI